MVSHDGTHAGPAKPGSVLVWAALAAVVVECDRRELILVVTWGVDPARMAFAEIPLPLTAIAPGSVAERSGDTGLGQQSTARLGPFRCAPWPPVALGWVTGGVSESGCGFFGVLVFGVGVECGGDAAGDLEDVGCGFGDDLGVSFCPAGDVADAVVGGVESEHSGDDVGD